MSIDNPTWLVDISQHQGPSVDFGQIKAEGYKGAIVKMTEGTGYVDPYGERNLRGTIAAGLASGAYHFIWGGMSPRKQALFFLQQVLKTAPAEDVTLFVDVEISGNMRPSQYPTLQDVRIFLKTIEEKLAPLGKRLGIYSGYYWRDHMGNPGISSLGLWQDPIIWDAHYFTQQVNWGSVLYQSVPRSYWINP